LHLLPEVRLGQTAPVKAGDIKDVEPAASTSTTDPVTIELFKEGPPFAGNCSLSTELDESAGFPGFLLEGSQML